MPRTDFVLNGFLTYCNKKMHEIAAQSDVFHLIDEAGSPPMRYLCELQGIEHMVKDESGIVHRSVEPLLLEIRIPADYLRSTDPNLGMRVVGIGSPIMHPNIRIPVICLGNTFKPGTYVHEILRMAYEIVTYRVVTTDEDNAFDPVACRYLRDNPGVLTHLRKPPLWRRTHSLHATVCGHMESHNKEQS